MTVNYISTRSAAPAMNFEQVLLAGLAEDGGLYVPETWPILPTAVAGLPYAELAHGMLSPFVDNAFDGPTLKRLVDAAYASFNHAAIAPLRQIDQSLWLLELFHGPTLAFKDVALQLLGQMFDHVLARQGRRVTIVGATSGDTGSAAIEAFRASRHADVFILLPEGRVSEVQRRQMTTVDAPNIHVIAIDGSFDDCQDLVKGLFADRVFRDRVSLSAVNSINWARIMAQAVYYAAAALALGAETGRKVAFAVPTGNFGNAYAGHVARRIGLPVESIIVASNTNDVLTRFFESGTLAMEAVVPTLSPAMDIQIASNFERLLFELYNHDGIELGRDMLKLRRYGKLAVTPARHKAACDLFQATRVDDAETLAEIANTYHMTGMVIDPHTAIAVAAARRAESSSDTAIVALASAHPAKFPDAVKQAIGITPPLPPNLADLLTRRERLATMAADIGQLQRFIAERVPA